MGQKGVDATARKLEIEIVGDTKGLSRALRKSETELSAFGSRIDKNVKNARGLAIGGGAAFAGGFVAAEALTKVKAAIDVASNLNEQTAKVGVVFGRAAGEIRAWAETTASSIGVAEDRALEAAGTLGNLTRAMGIGEAASSELSRTLVNLAGDLASFNNSSPEDALVALRSAIVGEYEPLRRMGSALSEARVKQQALIESGKASEKQLTNQDKVFARYHLILKDTALAQGDFARTSDTLANRERALAAEARKLQSNLGQLLVPAVSELTDGLVEATEAANKLFGALGDLSRAKLPNWGDTKPSSLKVPGVGDTPKTGNPVYDRIFGGVYERTMEALRATGLVPPVPISGARTDAAAKAFEQVLGQSAITLGPRTAPGATGPRSILETARKPINDLPVGFQNAILKAENERDRGGLLKSLVKGKQFYETQLQRAIDADDSKAVNEIRKNLQGVQAAIQGVYRDVNAETQAAKDAVEATRAKTKAATEKAASEAKQRAEELAAALRDSVANTESALQVVKLRAELTKTESDDVAAQRDLIAFYRKQASNPKLDRSEQLSAAQQLVQAQIDLQTMLSESARKQTESLRTQADKFKSAALARLDRRQDALTTGRAIEDAKAQLATARMIGGPAGIREALRDLEDAQLARQRFLLEGSRVSAGREGFTVTGGIHVYGVQNVDELIAELQRRSKTQPAQSRGRYGGGRLALD